tara:strand:+ start:482 stop:3022 length:2541 start_codon:yes stop_codon:yes gene_type:complete
MLITPFIFSNDLFAENSLVSAHYSSFSAIDSTVSSKVDTTISKDAVETKTQYKAKDSMRVDLMTQKIYLFGSAEVYYGNISLKADTIIVDLNKDLVFAKGGKDSTGKAIGIPEFTENGSSYSASEMTYNFKTKKGTISEVTTQEGEGYVKGDKVKKTATDVLYIKDGYYTTCNLDHPHYSLATSKLKVIPNNKIVTGPTVLKVGGVPTPLGLPFGLFPNKKGRSSGILIPAYGDSPRLGFFLKDGGYYFSVGERMDLKVTGDIYSKGSFSGRVESNYKKRYSHTGNLSLSYSSIRDGYREFPSFTESNEFWVNWRHTQDPKARPNSNFSASVQAGTSTNFTNNLNSAPQNYLSNNFQSSITYSKLFPNSPFSMNIGASHSQNTQTRQVSVSAPSVGLNMSRIFPFKGNSTKNNIGRNIGLSYSGNFKNTLNVADSNISINQLDNIISNEMRNGVQHSIPISTSAKIGKYITLQPTLRYNELWYFKTINKEFNTDNGITDADDNIIPSLDKDTISGFSSARNLQFSATLSTKIYGMAQFKKGKVKAIRHVITPQVSYSFTPEVRDGLKSYTDTTGKRVEYSIYEDGIFGRPNTNRSNRLNFNILNVVEMKALAKSDTGMAVKKIKLIDNLGLNTGIDFERDSLKWDAIRLTGRTRISELLNITFNGTFDPYAIEKEQGNRINELNYNQNGKLARFTNGNIAFQMQFRGGNKGKKKSDKVSEDDLDYINSNLDQYIDFNVPWAFGVSYVINYNKPRLEETITQTLNFNGELKITDKWKVDFNSGYDFERKDITYTNVNIYRDLHCWEMSFNWIPLGFQKSYNVTINVKASVLQDLKLNRRRNYYDLIN